MSCYSEILEASLLTSGQLAILTVVNLILMISNITANTLVIYVLIKTRQILQITCKLIFMLSTSDLLLGVFCQNLLFVMLFSRNCALLKPTYFLWHFYYIHHVIRWHWLVLIVILESNIMEILKIFGQQELFSDSLLWRFSLLCFKQC